MDGGDGRTGGQGKRESERNRRDADVVLARQARQAHTQTLVYSSRHFVGFGLPLTPPAPDELSHTVSNGTGSLTVEGWEKYGLPYGQDRLLIVWLASAFFAAGLPRDNTIRFKSVRNILQAFGQGFYKGGKEYNLLRARILRLFHCSFVWKIPAPGGHLKRDRGQLMKSLRLSFLDSCKPAGEISQAITLDATWADDLRNGLSVPYDLESIRALRRSPIALDLYLWQAWRSWRLARKPDAKPAEVPIFGAGGLLDQFGFSFSRPRKAKEVLRRHQARIMSLWPECPNYLDRNAERFVVRPAIAVAPLRQFVILPGVRKVTAAMRERQAPLSLEGGNLFAVRDDGKPPSA